MVLRDLVNTPQNRFDFKVENAMQFNFDKARNIPPQVTEMRFLGNSQGDGAYEGRILFFIG